MILVLGGRGSIGRRYCANLKAMGEEYVVYDTAKDTSRDIPKADMAIIATPTDTHGFYCRYLADRGTRFLCEKPLSMRYSEAQTLVEDIKIMNGDGYVVNNWEFALSKYTPKHALTYDFYNTGRDGIAHDCCQLIHIANKYDLELELYDESPVWMAMADGELIDYRDMEISYGAMLSAFIAGDDIALWTLEEGLEMVKDVVAYEASCSYSGSISLN